MGCKLSRPGGCQGVTPRPRRVPHVDCPALDARQHPGESQEPPRWPHGDRPPCRLPITDKLPRPVGGVQAVEAWRMPGRDRPSRGGCCLMETARLDGGSILEPHNRPPVGIVQIGHPKNARARAPARNINPTLVPVLGTPHRPPVGGVLPDRSPRPVGLVGCKLSRPGESQGETAQAAGAASWRPPATG